MSLKSILFVIFIPALMLSGCAPGPRDCARKEVFCAGLVTDFGPITEGINQEAWLGLQDARDARLVNRIDAIETIDVRDRARNISTLADDGYDVIITVGPSISDETLAAARRYPNLMFIGVEQPQDSQVPNLTGLVFNEDRSGFLAGALAALTTQTGRLAAVCEENFIDPMRRYCDGFQAGAIYINPGVTVTVSYRDGSQEKLFNDPVWGSTTALGAINAGADVLFAAGGATADGALETAAQQKITVVGAETDPYARLDVVRPWLMSSALNDIRTGILELVGQVRAGKLSAGNFFGPTRLAPFHEWDRQIPQSTKDRLTLIQKGLEDGSIKTGVPWLENNPITPTPNPQD